MVVRVKKRTVLRIIRDRMARLFVAGEYKKAEDLLWLLTEIDEGGYGPPPRLPVEKGD